MLQMLMMMGDDGEKEFSAEKGIYWRTDVYGPHSDDHDHDIGDHYEVDGNDVDHDHDAKATKSAAERGIYWQTDIYGPHTGHPVGALVVMINHGDKLWWGIEDNANDKKMI